jgi:hypothetical protein
MNGTGQRHVIGFTAAIDPNRLIHLVDLIGFVTGSCQRRVAGDGRGEGRGQLQR